MRAQFRKLGHFRSDSHSLSARISGGRSCAPHSKRFLTSSQARTPTIVGVQVRARLGLLSLALIVALAVSACSQNATPGSEQRHVFLIVMENKSMDAALQGPFTASLASRYRVATNYSAVAHPSLPNYLALTSGQTFGIRDDNYHVLPVGGIGTQLTAAGVSWRAYMEGMAPGGCMDNTYPYDVHHNPFAYYGGRCPSNVVPFSPTATGLKGHTPMFRRVSPHLCNDQHHCSRSVGGHCTWPTVSTSQVSPT